MSIPRIVGTDFGGPDGAPLLLLGPSLGTSAATLWSAAAVRSERECRVVGLGSSRARSRRPTASLHHRRTRRRACWHSPTSSRAETFHYAGDSVGGCVGLQLLLDAPHRVASATLLCTGAVDRHTGRVAGARGNRPLQAALRPWSPAAAQRWFATGLSSSGSRASARRCWMPCETRTPESYAQVCEALAGFDVADRLQEISTPVLAVAGGAGHRPLRRTHLQRIASGVKDGRARRARRRRASGARRGPGPGRGADRRARQAFRSAAPTTHRRRVCRRAWRFGARCSVTRTSTGPSPATTDFTADFQRMITEYAWGTIWTRPGLDLRSRSMITLTALVARGHHEELAMHLRAARRNGLTNDEIKELLMQTAIYCGVPDANTAFRIAAEVLPDFDDDKGSAVMSRTEICDTAREAVAGIEDGATVLVGGFGMAGMPTTLIDALIEQGAADLTIVSNNAGNGDTGLAALLAAGRVTKVICSFPRQADSYVFDALYRAGKVDSRWCRRAIWPSGSGRPARASARSSARPVSAPRWPRARRPAPSTAATTCWSIRSAATSR